jgi:hypothetical protein
MITCHSFPADGIKICYYNFAPFFGEAFRDALAESGASAGDDSNFAY